MSLNNWWKQLPIRLVDITGLRAKSRRRRRIGADVIVAAEVLEDRTLLAAITVNTTIDNTADDAFLTLREAILLVNNNGNASAALGRSLSSAEQTQVDLSEAFGVNDTISFDAALSGGTITLQIQPTLPTRLEIAASVAIQGLGASQLTIDGNFTTQLVFIDGPSATGPVVSLSDLSLVNGISLNGGAVQNIDGDLTISQTTIFNNSASGDGGGVYNEMGRLTIVASTLSNNETNGSGGGVYNLSGDAEISDSTLVGNQAGVDGGGVFSSGDGAIINSTISVNEAARDGGGVRLPTGSGAIINSTIFGNIADNDGTSDGTGGGVNTTGNLNSTIGIYNSIVAGNLVGDLVSRGPSDIVVEATGLGQHNLIGDPNSAGGFVHGLAGNIVGEDNGIGGRAVLNVTQTLDTTLQHNGGLTSTHALLAGSPAIDAGSNSVATTPGDDGIPGTSDIDEFLLVFDQRGQGFSRVVGSVVDIGAFETQIAAPPYTIVSVSPGQVEGNSGTKTFQFTVTRNDTSISETLDFFVSSQTATADDFGGTLPNGSVFFASSQATATISITVSGDTTVEPDEEFTVTLGVLSGINFVVLASTTATIFNDDIAPQVADVDDEPIATAAINGNAFREVVGGNFDASPIPGSAPLNTDVLDTAAARALMDETTGANGLADDLFFWDPATGEHRIVFGNGVVQSNPFPTTAINGNDFTVVLFGQFDEGGGSDLFFWNPQTGRNRLIHVTGGTGQVVGQIETNIVPQTAINGFDYNAVVAANLDNGGAEDLFFWSPRTGRNRLVHFQTVTMAASTDGANFESDIIDQTFINGETYETVSVGQFTGGQLPELLFISLQSGENRIAALVDVMPGESTMAGEVQTNMLPPEAFNGGDFERTEIADINGDGIDDVFAWNMASGANRIAIVSPLPVDPAMIVDDAIARGAINGSFSRLERQSGQSDRDELFFWDPASGKNRKAFT